MPVSIEAVAAAGRPWTNGKSSIILRSLDRPSVEASPNKMSKDSGRGTCI
ncbi:hypothetical protein [Bradyrhizobium frederickii]|nr:hypothetical protein [Bradyrhizobium frederickii]